MSATFFAKRNRIVAIHFIRKFGASLANLCSIFGGDLRIYESQRPMSEVIKLEELDVQVS